ncbi:MAG: EAL domain-containing protein [Marinagarivorans sp.]
MTQLPPDDELFIFAEEDEHNEPLAPSLEHNNRWKILIVDDDKEVHDATEFTLRGTLILNRPLEYIHAYSAKQAEALLREHTDIAVILLDVVMETPNAGLDLIKTIRGPLANTQTRIILRTGEPNQAPEIQIIRDYDINDYKLKSELNQKRLYTSLTSAIRNYRQICTIEASKKGLDLILRSSSELLTQEGLRAFAQGVIIHIAALLNVEPEGIICVRRRDSRPTHELHIIAAAGDYCPLLDRQLCDENQTTIYTLLNQSIDNRCNIFEAAGMALYLGCNAQGDMSCFIANNHAIAEMEQSLLQVFCANISICADNITFLEQLKNYAYHDTLVNLPNRLALEQIIDAKLTQELDTHYALALIDINHFADLNAVLGQEHGDRLLIAIAERLKNRFKPISQVARIGADIFAIFGPASHVNEARLLAPFSNPFEIAGELQLIGVSCGIAPVSPDTSSARELLKYANIVLKDLKQKPTQEKVAYFNPTMMDEAKKRLHLLKELRHAFDRDELFLAFQPKIALHSREVVGFEALIRWRNSRGQYVSPLDFIPLAEQSGLIVRLGEWVLSQAMRSLAHLRAQGFYGLSMAVNVSVVQLHHPEFLHMLQRVIGETSIEAGAIELEVTESVDMGNIQNHIQQLQSIKDLGFSLAIDDFGTGFSSLSYLQQMPIDCLKIDRSFIQVVTECAGANIVHMVLQLARALKLHVVAEGAETQEQVQALEDLGCDQVQGYYFAKPMPLDDLLLWLAAQRAPQ